jgi:hypothetical protein
MLPGQQWPENSRNCHYECKNELGKFVGINNTINLQPQSTTTPYLPKISMPQDAYKFLRAMDRMIGQLPAEAPANPAGWHGKILALFSRLLYCIFLQTIYI